jgi:hypothetical protein
MVDEPDQLTEEELLEQLQEEMRRITVPDYLRHLLVSLSSLAFQKLGFSAEEPADRDLDQSRMAIDAFEALSKVLAGGIPEEEASLYSSTLHQMRMAFLRASTETSVESTNVDGASETVDDSDTDKASGTATHIPDDQEDTDGETS